MSQKKTKAEIEGGTLDVSQTDISATPELETAIAARQRQILRNTAIQVNLAIALAKKREARDEMQGLSKQFDGIIRDITELDKLYPGAKKQMCEFDAQAIAGGRI